MLEFIYNHSPIFVQNLMVSVQGKIFMKQRYTRFYYQEMEELRKCEDVFKMQEMRFKEFYHFISENSDYYREELKNYPKNITIYKNSL